MYFFYIDQSVISRIHKLNTEFVCRLAGHTLFALTVTIGMRFLAAIIIRSTLIRADTIINIPYYMIKLLVSFHPTSQNRDIYVAIQIT